MRQRRGGNAGDSSASDAVYYRAVALQKLGRQQEAADAFVRLVDTGKQGLGATVTVDYFAKFCERQTRNARLAQAHYSIGLGLLGQGKRAESRAEFEEAAKLNPTHLGARLQMASLR